MISERRIEELETKIAHLEAIIDGSEAQTRDAAVYLGGIITRFLHEKGLIDERSLRDYVRKFEGDVSDTDDYMGDLVRRFGHMIDYHERYASDFELTGSTATGGVERAAEPCGRPG